MYANKCRTVITYHLNVKLSIGKLSSFGPRVPIAYTQISVLALVDLYAEMHHTYSGISLC